LDDETIEVQSNGVVLGDEGCIYLCLHDSVLDFAKKCKDKQKTVRFLTPIVPDRYMDDLVKRIEYLSRIISLKVTFNDYGLLHRCSKLIENKQIIPVFGRVLTRSMLDCNWAKRLLTNENDKVIAGLYEYSLMDNEKIKLLEEFHIQEIEVNYHPEKIAELSEVVKLPIVIYNNQLLSVGRVCFSARYQQLKLPNCAECMECRKKLQFSVNKKWSKKRMCYDEPDEEFKQYMSDLYVQGNVVYRNINDLHLDLQQNVIEELIYA
jgi:hypothetical protein